MDKQWIPICLVEDIPRQGARVLKRTGQTDVALFRNHADQVYALLDSCPHKGGPLSQGMLTGQHVACPLHNWHIDLDSGQAVSPDEGCTLRFAVQIEGGQVLMCANELAAPG